MTDTSEIIYDPRQYWKTRNFKTSARLHLQHQLFQNTIGYLVSPKIAASWKTSQSPNSIKVADLACGNGAWLIELAKSHLPSTSIQLQGFDINPVNFPAACHLPKNVKLEQLDILTGELPSELQNTFDLVHIRAFASIVHNNDISRVMKCAMSMLKPGGWLQWDESVPDQLTSISPQSDIPKSSCDTIIQILAQGAKVQNMSFDWIHELDVHLNKHELQNTDLCRYDDKPEDFKGWTENYLLVWEDLTALMPSKETAPQAPLTREMWQDLFFKAVEETDKGVVVHQLQIVVGIGQKKM